MPEQHMHKFVSYLLTRVAQYVTGMHKQLYQDQLQPLDWLNSMPYSLELDLSDTVWQLKVVMHHGLVQLEGCNMFWYSFTCAQA